MDERTRLDLAKLLVELGLKVQECETAQTELVEASSGASIVDELERYVNEPSKANEIISKALSAYTIYTESIESKLGTISATFSQVLEKNHSYAALRTQNEATKNREKALAALNSAIEKFKEISNAVRDGEFSFIFYIPNCFKTHNVFE